MNHPVPVRASPSRTRAPVAVTAPGRIRLDLARGVLMGWTGCDAGDAFNQLTAVAKLHSVSVFRLADAVLTTASTDPRAAATDAPDEVGPDGLVSVVRRCWAGRTLPAGDPHDDPT